MSFNRWWINTLRSIQTREYYYTALKRNELPSQEKTWRSLKRIWLSEAEIQRCSLLVCCFLRLTFTDWFITAYSREYIRVYRCLLACSCWTLSCSSLFPNHTTCPVRPRRELVLKLLPPADRLDRSDSFFSPGRPLDGKQVTSLRDH